MVLRNAIRTLANRKALGLTLLILAITAGTAIAATVGGDGTLVGTNGNDTLNTGNSNDTVWGLAGSDTINAGNGNDMIDGDGQCPQDDQGQDFPNGIPGTNQCEHGNQDQNGQGDTINAGNGNDTVFGGGGHNTINVGHGTDTIYGGPLGDTINTGARGTVTIHLGAGGHNTVNIGTGSSGTVYAQNGQPDVINCNGANVKVYADHIDTVNRCKQVIMAARDQSTAASSLRAHKAKTRHRTNRKHHTSSKRRHGYTF